MQIHFFCRSKLQTPTQLLLKSSDVSFGIDSAAFLHPHAQLADTINTHEVTSVSAGLEVECLRWYYSSSKLHFYQILLM